MIVRDEAEMVPGFLESIRGLWDELVIVDTGSIDGTPERFATAGARIVHHPWREDFAEARNVSLLHATKEWVLVLDPDERPSPSFIKTFLGHCARPDVGALALRISNPLPYGHRRESWVLRAFRRDDAVRFEHAIHEDASPSVARMLARTGRTIERVEPPIEHLGYVRSRAASKEKKQRDLRILSACIAKDGGDFYSRLKLLELARFWRDSVLWNDVARSTLEALGASPEALSGKAWGAELLALVSEGLFRPESEAGLAFLESWESRVVPAAPYYYRRAQHYEASGQLLLAKSDYERCLTLGEFLGDEQLTTVRPRLGLARLALMTGNIDLALTFIDEAIELQPRDPEALLAASAVRLQREGPTACSAWASAHTARFGPSVELSWAMGDAALTLGHVELAIGFLRRAAGVPPSGPPALRLAQALLASGQLTSSEQLTRQLLAEEPEAGLGVLLFDLLHGRDTELDLELTPETAHAAMRHWVDSLVRSGNLSGVLALRRNAPAVQQVFPWLDDYLRRTG
jgi:glycosyltransferase involved in cell wall biosynthesis